MLFNSNNFYPTKPATAYKLFSMFYEADKKKFVNCVHLLEPSAGKGDLIESFYNFLTDNEYQYLNKIYLLLKQEKNLKILKLIVDLYMKKYYNKLVLRKYKKFKPNKVFLEVM